MVKNISNLGDAAVYCDFGSEVNETINANNPSSNRLDFTYVKDAAKGIKLATFFNKNSINEFNITRGDSRSLQDAINIIKSFFPKIRINITDKKGNM